MFYLGGVAQTTIEQRPDEEPLLCLLFTEQSVTNGLSAYPGIFPRHQSISLLND